MKIKGIAISKGYSIGKAFVLCNRKKCSNLEQSPKELNVPKEIDSFNRAVSESINEIEQIKTNPNLSKSELDILEAHIDMLRDPQIKEDVESLITKDQKDAVAAVSAAFDSIVCLFEQMDDAYMKSKIEDIRDVAARIGRHINGEFVENLVFKENTILLVNNLTPSEVVSLDENVVGFATCLGGITSHSAIVAKSRGIPAIAGIGNALLEIRNGDTVVLDAVEGELLVNPEKSVLDDYRQRKAQFDDHALFLKEIAHRPSKTLDGVDILLEGNISCIEDMERLHANGGLGVGLLRTEVLFMGRDTLPAEEEQFLFYKQILAQARMQTVTIRTIDVGGDKEIPALGLSHETNPFLGYRAIRVCLNRPEIFIPQLRAILRASHFGKARIMFPMIIERNEIVEAKILLEEAKAQLEKENIPFDREIKVGIMIETPAAALVSDMLAKEVDFFSIGTNDLCQYTLAVDRMNERVSKLYNPLNIGLLRLINYVISKANEANISVSMCGELASDPRALPVLLGLGLREFSMVPESIPYIKEKILETDISKINPQIVANLSFI